MEEQNRNKETAPGEARRPSSVEEAEAAIEAVLFAMGDSVELGRIAKAIGHDTETTRRILNHMMEKYNTKDRGIHIVELENAYQMCTKQEYYDYLVNIAMQPKKAVLTDVMMETLSIIAYKQPVTKQEIDKIRGVKSDHAVNKLVEYNLVQELGREPTVEEIAAELNLPVEKIIEANRTAADTLSLDTPVGDEEDTSIGSFVEDERTPGPADATSNALLAEALKEILDTLTEREADVLRMRFGMYDGRTHTLEEVGQIFGVTRERIRQIENKAIRKLRHPSRAKKIRDFYC